jgi:DNA-binding transcriptional MerR regulator
MLLKVGELAKQTGLTVRALHHYDDIGLLQPSVRSDAGYRLYTRKDITRLHQIQALRGLGMSLAEIHTVLEDPNLALLPIIDRQIQAIDQRLAEQKKLRNQHMRIIKLLKMEVKLLVEEVMIYQETMVIL